MKKDLLQEMEEVIRQDIEVLMDYHHDKGLVAEAVLAAWKMINSVSVRTWLTGMVAAHIASYGGIDVAFLHPASVVRLLEGGLIVVYKGMAYSLDVWE